MRFVPMHQSYTYKKLNHAVGKAIHSYDMISDGDRIALGLSGGADSLTLIYILDERLKRIPVRYEVIAFHIDPGFDGGFSSMLEDYCQSRGYRLIVERTNHGLVAHSEENRENPCFLCSRLRRKRLFELAAANRCNKLALGHNKDDLIETLFMNICYAGEISTMLPSQPFFKGEITIIRPLAFADGKDIRRFVKDAGFPEFMNPCPSAHRSERSEMKLLLDRLYQENRKVKGNIFKAMSHVKPDYLLKLKTVV